MQTKWKKSIIGKENWRMGEHRQDTNDEMEKMVCCEERIIGEKMRAYCMTIAIEEFVLVAAVLFSLRDEKLENKRNE